MDGLSTRRVVRAGGSLVFALIVVVAGPASAGEGVLEINQSCAVNGGCFAGDTAGFPVTLSTAGSYRLTGDLSVPNANLDGILISASHVQLDLGGFSIAGPVSCTVSPPDLSGSDLVCTPASGSGTGVDISGVVVGVSVANGAVRGMGFRGVNLGDYSSVASLSASSNASTGITVGVASLIRDVEVERNGGIGLVAGDGSIVREVTARTNRSVGLRVFSGVNLTKCASEVNGSDGILASSGSSISDCWLFENASDGIQTSPHSNVARNAVHESVGFGVHNLSTTAPAIIRNNLLSDTNTLGNADNVLDLGGNYCGPTAPTTTCN